MLAKIPWLKMVDSTSSDWTQQSAFLSRRMAKLVMVMSNLFRDVSKIKQQTNQRDEFLSFFCHMDNGTDLHLTFDGHHNFDELKQGIDVNGNIGRGWILNGLEDKQ